MADEHINVQAPALLTPNPNQQGFEPQLVDDIVPPRYPNGCELAFFRPGGLEPVVRVGVPAGAMVMMITPEQAAMIRPAIQDFVRRQRAAMAQRNGMGKGS